MTVPADPMPLIPTVARANLRPGESYPVGAQLVSRGLAGVPQFQQLSISFERQAVMEGDLSVLYDSRAGGWRIVVRSVPSSRRADVRRALSAVGLPAARAWLAARRTETWYGRDRQFAAHCWGEKPHISLREFEKPRDDWYWRIMPTKEAVVEVPAEPGVAPDPRRHEDTAGQ